MLRFLHSLSAWLFYPLAGSFFVAYLLLRHQLWGEFPLWWLSIMDLPLLLAGVLYGVSSVTISVTDPDNPSKGLLWGTFLPAVILLLAVLLLNFGLLPA